MRIQLSEPTYGEDEIAEVIDSLRSTRVTMGAKCRAFEQAFADYSGARHAVFVNSGSSANLLAWFAVANPLFPEMAGRRWRPGAEVIVPAVTWSTTLWPIVQAGGVPVLVDCDPATLQMRPDAVAAAIGPDTVALCPVHALGNCCAMEALTDLCRDNGLTLVEDTCEALGARYNGTLAGRFGLMGTFSFFFSHHITTIEGGMVVTDDDRVADLLRCLRAHGWTRDLQDKARWGAGGGGWADRFTFVNTGFNLRPTEINGAFGLHQIAKLDGFNARRRWAAAELTARLAPLLDDGRIASMGATPGAEPAHFGFPLLCRSRAERDGLAAHLEAAGVEVRPIICGNMARQPAMAHVRHRIAGRLDGADRIMECGLYFGMHPSYGEQDIDFVADAVAGYFRP